MLPETNSSPKWMLEDDSFPFGFRPIFRGELLVFRECIQIYLWKSFGVFAGGFILLSCPRKLYSKASVNGL